MDHPRFLTKTSINSVYVTILFGFNTMYVNNRIFLVRINPESWFIFYKAGPGSAGGTTVVNYGPGGVTVTYKPPIFGPLPPITLPPGLLPPGVVSPPGFHNKFIHNGALSGVPIIGAPPSIPISGLGSVLSSDGNAILNGVENGWNWLVTHI